MKFKLLLLIILMLFLIIPVKGSELKLIGKVIYIDPGHGGMDPGCVYKDIYEKDINLKIALKLRDELEKNGAIVYLTRDSDVDLSSNTHNHKKSDLNNRIKAINNSKADLFISIHLNSISSSTWRGAQVFYDDVNEKNIEIANLFQQQLKQDLKTNKQVKEISTMLMNRKITIPGILIEVGFLSNPNDRYLLRQDDYQYKISNSIRDGLIKYFNN